MAWLKGMVNIAHYQRVACYIDINGCRTYCHEIFFWLDVHHGLGLGTHVTDNRAIYVRTKKIAWARSYGHIGITN